MDIQDRFRAENLNFAVWVVALISLLCSALRVWHVCRDAPSDAEQRRRARNVIGWEVVQLLLVGVPALLEVFGVRNALLLAVPGTLIVAGKHQLERWFNPKNKRLIT